jgi:hypothetical protein
MISQQAEEISRLQFELQTKRDLGTENIAWARVAEAERKVNELETTVTRVNKHAMYLNRAIASTTGSLAASADKAVAQAAAITSLTTKLAIQARKDASTARTVENEKGVAARAFARAVKLKADLKKAEADAVDRISV